jgi:hypothetical protein
MYYFITHCDGHLMNKYVLYSYIYAIVTKMWFTICWFTVVYNKINESKVKLIVYNLTKSTVLNKDNVKNIKLG